MGTLMTCVVVTSVGVIEATQGSVSLPAGFFGLYKDCVKADPDQPPKTL